MRAHSEVNPARSVSWTLLLLAMSCVLETVCAQTCGPAIARVRTTFRETAWGGLSCPTCLVQEVSRDSGPPAERVSQAVDADARTTRFANLIQGGVHAGVEFANGEVQIEHELLHANVFQGGVVIHDFALGTDVDFYVPGASGSEYAIALDLRADSVTPSYYGRALSYELTTRSGIRVSALSNGWSGIARGRTSGATFQHNGIPYSFATTVHVGGGASAGYSCIIGCVWTPWNMVAQSLKLSARALTTTPSIEITPDELDFGRVVWRQSRDLTLSIRNSGLATLAGQVHQLSRDPQFQLVGETDFRLGPNERHVLTVRFSAAAAWYVPGSKLLEETIEKFQIHSNDPCRHLVVLSATATRERPLPRFKRCEVMPDAGDERLLTKIVFESPSGDIDDLFTTLTFPDFFRERLGVVGSADPVYYPPTPPFNVPDGLPNPASGYVDSYWYPERIDRLRNEAFIIDGHGPHSGGPHGIQPYRPAAYELWQRYEYNLGGMSPSEADWVPIGPQFTIRREITHRSTGWYYVITKSGCPGELVFRLP